ncbi:MOSC domain-containing protein [Chloroflexota bacterium]
MVEITHLTMAELEAGLDKIRQSPKDEGRLEMIVRRPSVDQREVLETGQIDLKKGLVGDYWRAMSLSRSGDGTADPHNQITIMNSRVIALLAGDKARWPLAGDQLFIDLDLSDDNLPPGSRLALGAAVLEVSATPHTGCKKFAARYGLDAVKFVNSPVGKQLNLRGINVRVIQPGEVRVGDLAKKL